MDLTKLKEPFPANEIEWRLQQCGTGSKGIWAKCLAYVTNRAICNRLDEVCGAENWKNEFTKAPDGGVLCGISIKCDGEWVTKYDGAENTDIEGVKGGLSGSMKRAASTGWGIGRYLYNLDEGWANVCDDGKYMGKTKDGKTFRWNAPTLPSWALPNGEKSEPPKASLTKFNSINTQQVETEEIKKLKIVLTDWVNAGTVPDEWLKKVDLYMANNDVEGMTRVIDWCKEHSEKV